MQEIEGYSVLVTGGGSGLGAQTARHFADHGARVTISGRSKTKIEAVAEEIGANCLAVAGDVTVASDREQMIAAAVRHGGGLQGLVNNAGNMLRGPITDLDEQQVLDLLHTNVVAGMMLTGAAVPHLEKDGGAVLFFGSVHSRRAFPGASPYAASKGAAEVVSRVLAGELGPRGIRVNCILPGAVPTDINIRAGLFENHAAHVERLQSMVPDHPIGRIGVPQEIAEAVDYLMRAEWTTGTSMVVDGGLSLGVSAN